MADTNKLNILIVDDEPKSLMALESVLSDLGQNVIRAQSAREALRHVLVTDFAVILLDVRMPGIDGLETAALIRERERSRATPIIFLTAAMRSEASVFKGYSVGAVDYLFKPIVPEILRSKVAIFVELAQKTTELNRLNGELRDQVSQLTATNRELDAFSYSASHDLQAPVRHILGFSRALTEECGEALPQIARDYLARIDKATHKMVQLIEDLLALSRVTRSEIKRVSVDFAAMANSIAADLRKSAPQREVEFLISSPLLANGDSNLLRIVLENLLGNAWKYTRKLPRATIEVGSRLAEDGREVYYVGDDGVGFDMAYVDKLFAPFRRLHSESEFEGSGIGLATVQRIIHRHGGRIWAESAPNKGATFYFTLS